MSNQDLFSPGDNLILLREPNEVLPKHDSLSVSFPGRIHVTPIDCNRFDFGRPGGGGLGFAISMDNMLHIKVSKKDTIISKPIHEPLLKHYVLLLKHVFKFNGYLEVNCQISDIMRQHSELGSSISIATACTQGVNALFG